MPQYKSYQHPFVFTSSSQEEKAMMKGYGCVNKKLKLIPQIYYAAKPLQ